MSASNGIQRLNPVGLLDTRSFGFSQVVMAPSMGRAVFVSGQFSGDTAGSIFIRAGDFEMDTSVIFANTVDGDGGIIDVQATDILVDGDIDTEQRSSISTQSFGVGDAGDIRLQAEESVVIRGGRISSVSGPEGIVSATGDGGDITVRAASTNASTIASTAGSAPSSLSLRNRSSLMGATWRCRVASSSPSFEPK